MARHDKPQITNITPDSYIDEGRLPVHGYRVEFITPSGMRSFVQVPRSDDLHGAIEREVAAESERLEKARAVFPHHEAVPPKPTV